jgi:hypothetical protein
MCKKVISNLLRIPLLLVSLTSLAIIQQTFASDGYIWEDVWIDLYSKVDANIGSITQSLAEKRIAGSSARIEEAIKKACGVKKKLLPGRDFNYDELTRISRWDITPLTSELNATQGGLDTHNLESNTIVCIAAAVKEDFNKIRTEAGYERKTLSTLSKVGLYSDGSIDNSSFDLMYDLDKIHSIIFAKELPYNGTPNGSAGEFGKYITAGPRLAYDSLWSKDNTPTSPTLPSDRTNPSSGGENGASWNSEPTTNNSSPPYCPPGETIEWLDDSLIVDINNQQTNGGNGGSSVWWVYAGSTTRNIANWAGTKAPTSNSTTKRPVGWSSFWKFGCKDFFCIDIDFISYNQWLLTGWRSFSIQSVLEMNMKIVTEFAGSSFTQAKHTNNFFELLLKNLNLPGMSHIGIVVTSLPAPILNLPGKDTPRGNPPESENEKEFTEIETGVLMDYGFDVKRVNSLEAIASNPKDYSIQTLSSLDTNYASKKFTPADIYRVSYTNTKQNAIQGDYGSSFAQDLNQFEAFTKAFVDHIGNFISLIEKIDEIPQG